jgi:hypothetical protein
MSLQRFKVIRTALVAKGAVDPPVPVPNTVVKRSSTYNTAGSTSVGRSAAASAVLLLLFALLEVKCIVRALRSGAGTGFISPYFM